jgi:hypothetical protein
MGKVVKPQALVDESLNLARHPPKKVLLFSRGPRPEEAGGRAGMSNWQSASREGVIRSRGSCAWLEPNEPSTFSTPPAPPDKPKGVQRDVGGLRGWRSASSMKHISAASRRDHVHHLRHRLGGGPFVHHLCAADRRHDDDHVRGRADPPRRRACGGRSCRTTRWR